MVDIKFKSCPEKILVESFLELDKLLWGGAFSSNMISKLI